MQPFGVREETAKPSEQTDKRPSENLEKVRSQLLAERQSALAGERDQPQSAVATTHHGPSPPATAGPAVNAEKPGQVVSVMQATLRSLDEEQLLQILEKIPAHQLACALQRILKPAEIAPKPDLSAEQKARERRGAVRSRTLRIAKIVYNQGTSLTNCEIRDISDTGCRVSVASTIGIPDRFTLQIPNEHFKRSCFVAWRKSGMMGLKFEN